LSIHGRHSHSSLLAGRVPNLLKPFGNDWTLEGFSDKKVFNGIELSARNEAERKA